MEPFVGTVGVRAALDERTGDLWEAQVTIVAGRERTGGMVLSMIAATLPMFSVSMNNLVITSALPSIGADLHIGMGTLHWVFNAYVLVFAAGLLATAGLGERFGHRRAFLAGIAWFGVASVGCALARDVGTLIGFRVLQGMGAAVVLPLSLTLLTRSVEERHRNLAVGVWSGFGGFSLATGALIGGAVTSGLSWRWIFWINIPVAVAAIVLAARAFRRGTRSSTTPDLLSALLIGGAIAFGVWAITEIPNVGWPSVPLVGGPVGCLLCLAGYQMRQGRIRNPSLPRDFYRNKPLLLTNFACVSLYFGVFGSVYFLMQYLQGPEGYSPWEAGLRTLPWTAMPLITSPLTGLLIARLGAGRILMAAATLQAAGLGWIAWVARPGLPYDTVIVPLVLAGCGMGMEFAATNALTLDSVAPHQHNIAICLRNSSCEIGGALGVAVLTTVFQFAARTPRDAGPDVRFVAGLVPAVWVGVAVILTGAIAGWAITRNPPAHTLMPAETA